jgi:hypothetical protein
MEEIYKKVMGSDMDMGAIFMFEREDLPPLEGKTDDEGEGDDGGGDDKDEGDDKGGGNDDEGGDDDDGDGDDDDGDDGGDEVEMVEAFKKQHEELNEELFQYRSVILQVFNYILEKAKEHYDKGEDDTVYFTKIAKGVTIPPLKLTREVM